MVYEVSKAGYEAATDPNATHPYGRPGETAERHRREQMRPVQERIARERAESEVRRRWFAERRRREREGLDDFMGPLMPSDGHASPSAAFPRPGLRLRRDDLGALAPAIGGDGSGAQAVAGSLATSDGVALEQVTAKASAAFTGRAELSVKVDAGPMLLVTIERMVKMELDGLNTTGIGSVGHTDTTVDPHR